MLKYIGTSDLLVGGEFIIKTGDIIKDEHLCTSLEHREDFEKVEPNSAESERKDEKVLNKDKRKE